MNTVCVAGTFWNDIGTFWSGAAAGTGSAYAGAAAMVTAETASTAAAVNFLIWYDLKPFLDAVTQRRAQRHRYLLLHSAAPIFRNSEICIELRDHWAKLSRTPSVSCFDYIYRFID